MRKVGLFALIAFYQWVSVAWADTVILKNGTRYDGTFVEGSSREITFVDQSGSRRRFDIGDVRSVEFGSYSGQPYSDQPTAYPPSSRSSAASALEERVIPSGAELVVRTNEEINSSTATTARTYSGVVERDVADSSGAMVIPRGSEVRLVVKQISEGGAFGSPELALDVQSVTVGGQRYAISTADVERQGRGGIGATRRTAEMVGGGALIGTVLGAIAGGGKGAAIGAIAGAVAGGAAQVLTRGKEVKVPAETVLTFRLDQPVRLQAFR